MTTTTTTQSTTRRSGVLGRLRDLLENGADRLDRHEQNRENRRTSATTASTESTGPSTHFSVIKAVAFALTIAVWAYGLYYGWLALPDFGALGDLFAVVLILLMVGLLVFSAFVDNVMLRLLGLLGVLIVGVVLGSTGADVLGIFDDFTLAGTFGTLLAILLTGVVMFWICRSPDRDEPQPAADPQHTH